MTYRVDLVNNSSHFPVLFSRRLSNPTQKSRWLAYPLSLIADRQLAGVNAQTGGELQDVAQRQVAPTSFDLADEGPVQARGEPA